MSGPTSGEKDFLRTVRSLGPSEVHHGLRLSHEVRRLGSPHALIRVLHETAFGHFRDTREELNALIDGGRSERESGILGVWVWSAAGEEPALPFPLPDDYDDMLTLRNRVMGWNQVLLSIPYGGVGTPFNLEREIRALEIAVVEAHGTPTEGAT